MKYVLLTPTGTVAEIIPENNPELPGVPIEERYHPQFLSQLIAVDDDTVVEQNYVYDALTGTFSEPEPVPEEVPEDA